MNLLCETSAIRTNIHIHLKLLFYCPHKTAAARRCSAMAHQSICHPNIFAFSKINYISMIHHKKFDWFRFYSFHLFLIVGSGVARDSPSFECRRLEISHRIALPRNDFRTVLPFVPFQRHSSLQRKEINPIEETIKCTCNRTKYIHHSSRVELSRYLFF